MGAQGRSERTGGVSEMERQPQLQHGSTEPHPSLRLLQQGHQHPFDTTNARQTTRCGWRAECLSARETDQGLRRKGLETACMHARGKTQNSPPPAWTGSRSYRLWRIPEVRVAR